jgi:hypothetical protein
MNGADVHDQLRLQSYSIQQAYKFQKYYKSIFLGLVDMALVNAYIVHRDVSKKNKKKALTHYDFMLQLSQELTTITAQDLIGDEIGDTTNVPVAQGTLAATIAEHELVVTDEVKTNGKKNQGLVMFARTWRV